MLNVLKLHPDAKLPTVAHWGEDIGYDLYSIETVFLPPGAMRKIRTGIAFEFVPKAGAIFGTRSGHASEHLDVRGGWIDAGYRDELLVMLKNTHDSLTHRINAGDKIAQFKRVEVASDIIVEVAALSASSRGKKGFGSSGR